LQLNDLRLGQREVRLIFVRFVVSSSVMPSAKYSWLGSPERFSNGSTAKERMLFSQLRPRQYLTKEKKTTTKSPHPSLPFLGLPYYHFLGTSYSSRYVSTIGLVVVLGLHSSRMESTFVSGKMVYPWRPSTIR